MRRSHEVDTEESVRVRLVREGVARLDALTQAGDTELLVTPFRQPLPAYHVAPQQDRIQNLDLTEKSWPLIPSTLLALTSHQLAQGLLWLYHTISAKLLSPNTPTSMTLLYWGDGESSFL